MRRLRRPVCGRYGPWVVAGLCAYELVALARPPIRQWFPPITQIARRWPVLGAVLIGVLTHHIFLEIAES